MRLDSDYNICIRLAQLAPTPWYSFDSAAYFVSFDRLGHSANAFLKQSTVMAEVTFNVTPATPQKRSYEEVEEDTNIAAHINTHSTRETSNSYPNSRHASPAPSSASSLTELTSTGLTTPRTKKATSVGPVAKKPKLSFLEKEAQKAALRKEKDDKLKAKAEEKARKEEEKAKKDEEKRKANEEKEAAKRIKEIERAEKQKEKDAKKQVEQEKKNAAEAAKLKKERVSNTPPVTSMTDVWLGSNETRCLLWKTQT